MNKVEVKVLLLIVFVGLLTLTFYICHEIFDTPGVIK